MPNDALKPSMFIQLDEGPAKMIKALHADSDPDDGKAPQDSDNDPGNKTDETT